MKTLILMRHAKAEPQSISQCDLNRSLQSRGKRDSKKAAGSLLKMKVMIDMLITSPAVRATKTAQIIRKKLGKNMKSWSIREGLYGSDTNHLSNMIRQTPAQINTLMLIGHNPELDELASQLAGHAYHLRTASVILFDYQIKGWDEIFHTKPVGIVCVKA